MNWQVPLFDTSFGNEELDAVAEVVSSGWLTCGARTQSFEDAFSRYVNAGHAVAVSSCTAALHLALLAAGVEPGDEVILPSMTFVATASSVKAVGATPVFADIESRTMPMVSAATLERMVTARTRAVIVVHYAGYMCDMLPIMAFAHAHDLTVVEDCAHAPGAQRHDRFAGTWGDVGCFSFYSNKNLSTGEGGMVLTENEAISRRVRLLRSHGLSTDVLERHHGKASTYDVLEPGFNYRPTELTAAIGLVQLSRLAENNRLRADIARKYEELIGRREIDVELPCAACDGTSAHHIFPVLLGKDAQRGTIIDALKTRGVQTSIHYPPVHRLTAFRGQHRADLSLSEEFGARELTLPLYPGMTESQIEYVVESLALALDA